MTHGKSKTNLSKEIVFLSVFLFYFILLSSPINALMVGVAPGSINLGTVKRGQKIKLQFYIVSDTTELLPVKLEYREIGIDTLRFSGDINVDELSEENFKPWINFIEGTTVQVPPEKKFYEEAGLYANKKCIAILNIPTNAEPGYHTANIVLLPQLPPPTAKQFKLTMITTAEMRLLFRVEGNVKKDIQVLNFLSKREDPTTLLVMVFVKNDGNVTSSAELKSFKIFDKKGKILISTSGDKKILPPGKIDALITRINVKLLEEGKKYPASAVIDYGTHTLTKNTTIEVPVYVSKVKRIQKGITIPWEVYLIILIIFILILYYWKIR